MAKIKVLYVEDHEDTREVVAVMLQRKGFEVITAVDCKSGIAIGISESFDVLVSDIALPDGSGIQVANQLHALKSFPAIAVTGHACQGADRQMILESFDECLVKPFAIAQLVALIERLYQVAQA